MTRIVSSVPIRRPPGEVFDYVSTPANWPKWHPSSVRVTGDAAHPQAVGERCTEEFVVAGRRGRTEWTVTRCERPSVWRIETHGGAGSVTYELAPSADGTAFTRTLEYTMPNPFLAALNVLVLRARVVRESETAVQNLRRVLEDAYQLVG
jgi:uncharacterized protein YndB with AHSA1/START domain